MYGRSTQRLLQKITKHRNFQTSGNPSPDVGAVYHKMYEWIERFKTERISVKYERRSSRPSTSRTDEHIQGEDILIRGDRTITLLQGAVIVGISSGSAHDMAHGNEVKFEHVACPKKQAVQTCLRE